MAPAYASRSAKPSEQGRLADACHTMDLDDDRTLSLSSGIEERVQLILAADKRRGQPVLDRVRGLSEPPCFLRQRERIGFRQGQLPPAPQVIRVGSSSVANSHERTPSR